MVVKTRVKTCLAKRSVSPSRWTEQNTASTLTYQVWSNEQLREGNGQGRQRICFLPGEVSTDKHGKTQGWYIWYLRELMKNEALSKAESSTWLSLKSVVTNFMGNDRSAEYEKEIVELLRSFRQLGVQMSVKLHFLQLHLNYFPWGFEWRVGSVLSPRRSHYGRVLQRLVGCKVSRWLLLMFETGCGGYRAQKEVAEKICRP